MVYWTRLSMTPSWRIPRKRSNIARRPLGDTSWGGGMMSKERQDESSYARSPDASAPNRIPKEKDGRGGGREGGREGRGKAQAYLEQHAHVLDKGHCDLDAVVRRLSQED